jgi:glycosyltransferase involved in cell wall biosynthesis
MKKIRRDKPGNITVAHFTDTFYDVSGVVRTLHKMARCAQKFDKGLTFVTCAHHESIMDEKVFTPIQHFALPAYSELEINYPPVLEVMDYCYENNFTHFHAATPGPMGLAALLMAKIFKRPIYSTYHTAFPQYVRSLIGSTLFEDATWKYMRWFYNNMDIILVPSRAFGQELIDRGFDKSKLRLMHRGVDTKRFVPARQYGERNGVFNLLYVGRISREKNLDILADAFKQIEGNSITLTIVGDGPYRRELEESLAGYNVIFTGYKDGDDLVRSYRDADLFVFPSTTDTFGNVVLEAQACGIPVIVSDIGGPHENIVDGETGWVVRGNSVDALCDAIKKSLNRSLLTRMSEKASAYAKRRDFDEAFLKTWDYYKELPVRDA